MSVEPEALWSERFAVIGSILESDYNTIIDRWAERALEEQPNAPHVHFKEMRNALPAMLQAMGRALAECGTAPAMRHCLIALEHGETRWKAGWRLAEVVRDYQILRLVILEHLELMLPSGTLTVREMMAVGLALDEAIGASVVAYVGHQEQQMRQASERLNEFLAVLGHELRNPLNAITTTVELLKLQQLQAPLLGDATAVLDRQTAQLGRLLDDMLDVTRIARGKLELRKELVSVEALVEQAVESTRPMFASRGQTLHLEVSDGALLHADRARLVQVLTNLLTNSAKYTPPDGDVWLLARIERDQAIFAVRDTGEGIAPDVLPHIFEMFAQAPEHRRQGLGIGLSLAKTLVELHGGTIEAHSDGPGTGTTFTVRIPLADGREHASESAQAAAPSSGPARQSPRRILLIDDQVDGLQELRLLLKLYGHEVHLAHSGEEGVRQALLVRPDVILLDLHMPGMDGYETAKRLRRQRDLSDTMIVAMTGYPEQADRGRVEQGGFDHALSKPVSFSLVQSLLEQREARR